MNRLNRHPLRQATGAMQLRTLLMLLLVGAGVYVAGMSLYLALRVAPAAGTLRLESQPMLALFTRLNQRIAILRTAGVEANRLVAAAPETDTAAVRRVRRLVVREDGRITPAPAARVSSPMRAALARADDEAARLQTELLELVALLELQRHEELMPQLARVDSLEGRAVEHLAEAQALGFEELRARERALTAASAGAVTAVAWWLAAGLLLVPVLVLVWRRRLARPIGELERGLARVAGGDLGVALPVHRPDEVGRLVEHFNAMTRVLRDRAEEQGRFAAAGELIAGIAHEVNNPLMAITALTGPRVDDPSLAPELRAEMQQIHRQARRAGKLLSGLLRFVRSEPREVGDVDVNAVVRDATELVSYQFGVEEIVLDERLDARLPTAAADGARLEQVCVNLLSNAVDAMRDGEAPRRLTVETWADGTRVCVAVTDTGPGIPATVAQRLFRPFVTTKGARGTGLGLYISRQIMREVGGDLELATTAPAGGGAAARPGARFVLWLPASATGRRSGEVPMPLARPAIPGGRPLAGLRLLVVDDEDAVRAPIVRFLSRRGATVREAGDGREAVEVLGGEEVDVILADLRMPRMSGTELYAWLHEMRPELARRTVLISGDITQLAESGGCTVPSDRVLLKPVELKEIEAKVLEVAAQKV